MIFKIKVKNRDFCLSFFDDRPILEKNQVSPRKAELSGHWYLTEIFSPKKPCDCEFYPNKYGGRTWINVRMDVEERRVRLDKYYNLGKTCLPIPQLSILEISHNWSFPKSENFGGTVNTNLHRHNINQQFPISMSNGRNLVQVKQQFRNL